MLTAHSNIVCLLVSLVLISSQLLTSAADISCDHLDVCSCKMSDTGKIVSLWEINSANGIR